MLAPSWLTRRRGRLGEQHVMIIGGMADIGDGEEEQAKVRIRSIIVLADLETTVPIAEIHIPIVAGKRLAAMCKNPFDFSLIDDKPRFLFLPDEDEATNICV